MGSTQVIARGFGGEPLHRLVTGNGRRLVYIMNPSLASVDEGPESVGFPETDVFLYDPDSFKVLLQEWETTGKTSANVWSALRRYQQPRQITA